MSGSEGLSCRGKGVRGKREGLREMGKGQGVKYEVVNKVQLLNEMICILYNVLTKCIHDGILVTYNRDKGVYGH